MGGGAEAQGRKHVFRKDENNSIKMMLLVTAIVVMMMGIMSAINLILYAFTAS